MRFELVQIVRFEIVDGRAEVKNEYQDPPMVSFKTDHDDVDFSAYGMKRPVEDVPA